MTDTRQRVDWSATPMVFVVLPVCDHCGSPKYDRVRTAGGGDGSVTKKVICRECGHPYRIILELPETGNLQSAIGYGEGGD